MKFFSTNIRYLLIFLVIIPVVGVVAASVYLNSSAFRNVMLGRVNAALDGRLTIAGHRLSLLYGRLALFGIRLERADGQPLAQAAHLEIGIVPSALLRRTIHISGVTLEKVRLLLAFDDQDRLLLVGPAAGMKRPAESKETAAPWQVIVDDYRLQEGELVFQRPAQRRSGRIENIRLEGALDMGRKQGRLEFSAGPLVWRQGDTVRTLPTLKMAAQYDAARASGITLETAGSRLTAEGRLILDGAIAELDATADLDLDLEEVRAWIPAGIRLEGRTAGRIAARGRLNDPDVNLHLTLPRGNLAGIAVAPLNADINFHQGKVSLSVLDARGPWGTLKAVGGVDLSNGRIEKSTATLTLANLADLGPALGEEPPSGSGSVKLSCEGPWTRPTARAQVLGREIKWRQYRFGNLVAAGDLNESGEVRLSRLVLENQGSLVEGRGRLLLQQADGGWRVDPGLDLALDVENLDPADFGLAVPVQGLVNAALKIDGTVHHIQAKAALQESSLKWRDQTFGLRGSVQWNDGRLNVPELSLSRDDATVRLKGHMLLRNPSSAQWLDAPVIEADLRSQGVQLQDVFPDFSGPLALEAHLKGPPADLAGRFRLTGNDLDLAGQPLAAVDLKGRVADNSISLDTIEITVAAGQRIQGKGLYAFDRRFHFTLDAEGIGLNQIPALQRAYAVEGLLALSLKGRGTLEKPLVTADVTIRQPKLRGQSWDDFHLQARLQERQLDLDADLNFKLKAHGRLDSGDFNVTARLEDADLSPYLAMGGGAQWGGKLSGRLEARGNWHRPRQIRMDLDIAEALLRYQSLDLLSTRQLRVRLQDGLVELPPSRLDFMQNGFLNLSASGDLHRELRLTTDGRLPLAALAPFSDLLTGARGDLVFQASVDGPVDALQWQADVNLKEIALEIPGLDQEVQDLLGRVRINSRELTVEQVTGRMGGGGFTLAGRVELTDLKPCAGKLVFNAQSLPLQWPDTMDAVVNCDLTLESADNKNALSGQVVLLEGTYYKDVRLNLLSAVSQPQRAEPVPTVLDLPPWLAGTNLNVALNHRYPFLVDNNLAQLQIAPDLKVAGTLGRPVVSGRAQVTEGEVIFRRKTFTVKRGVVDFINPYKIEPTLDIAAEARIRQWLVSLNLSGTPDRMVFKLRSDPSESENDILSLILLGRTGSELAGGQGGGGQTTRQMLAALVATAWGEDVKKTTGVDILEVDTGTDDTDADADTIQVTVGKRLSRRLTIKYEMESGSEELIQRAVSEYRFLENLLASGFQDSQGGYGGELLFRIEF